MKKGADKRGEKGEFVCPKRKSGQTKKEKDANLSAGDGYVTEKERK